MARRRKKKEEAPRTLEQDSDDIGLLYETLIDEVAMLSLHDERLETHLYGSRYIVGEKTAENVRQMVIERRIKGLHDTLMTSLKNLERDIRSMATPRDEHYIADSNGVELGQNDYRTLEGPKWSQDPETEGYLKVGGRYVTRGRPYTHEELYGRYSYQKIDNTNRLPPEAQPDETLHEGFPQQLTRPAKILDPEKARPTLETLEKLRALLKAAKKRHNNPKPIWRELIERLAGKGPMKFNDIRKLHLQIRLERGGVNNSHSNKDKSSMESVIRDLSKVKNPIQGGWHKTKKDDIWEIPADFKLNLTKHQELREIRSKMTPDEKKEHTRQLKAEVTRLVEEMTRLIPETVIARRHTGRDPSNYVLTPDPFVTIEGEKSKLWQLRRDYIELAAAMDSRTVAQAIKEAWPGLNVENLWLGTPEPVISQLIRSLGRCDEDPLYKH